MRGLDAERPPPPITFPPPPPLGENGALWSLSDGFPITWRLLTEPFTTRLTCQPLVLSCNLRTNLNILVFVQNVTDARSSELEHFLVACELSRKTFDLQLLLRLVHFN